MNDYDLVEARRAQRQTDARTAHALTAALRPHGIALATYETLAELAGRGGTARPGDLATAIAFSPSGMSRIIDQAIGRGWVTRSLPYDGDGRGRVIALTPAGAEVLAAATPRYLRALRSVLQPARGRNGETQDQGTTRT